MQWSKAPCRAPAIASELPRSWSMLVRPPPHGRGIRPRSARYPHFTERTCPRHLRTGSSQYLIRAVAGDRVGAVEPAAYESYLRGRSFWNQRTPAGLNQAIGHFQRAIELD